MDVSFARLNFTSKDEEVLRRGGPVWAGKGVCIIPDELCTQVNPAYQSGACLGILGKEDVDEAKKIAEIMLFLLPTWLCVIAMRFIV